jgi:hypothetical protein
MFDSNLVLNVSFFRTEGVCIIPRSREMDINIYTAKVPSKWACKNAVKNNRAAHQQYDSEAGVSRGQKLRRASEK